MLPKLEVQNYPLEVCVSQFLAGFSAPLASGAELFSSHALGALWQDVLWLVGVVVDDISDLFLQIVGVAFFVHFVENLNPNPLFNSSLFDLLQHAAHISFTFMRVLVLNNHLDKLKESVLDILLHEPEIFVTLILQNLGK